jgi:maleate cis-trans isomerase
MIDFEALTPYVKGLSKKQYVTLESLRKIEDGMSHLNLLTALDLAKIVFPAATYGIVVRGSEYEGSQEIIDDIVEKYVSGLGFSSSSRPTDRWGGAGRGGGGDFGEDDEYIY